MTLAPLCVKCTGVHYCGASLSVNLGLDLDQLDCTTYLENIILYDKMLVCGPVAEVKKKRTDERMLKQFELFAKEKIGH